MVPKNSDTFIKITNKEIYEEILLLNKKIDTFVNIHNDTHSNVSLCIEKLSGKSKINRWIATTGIVLFLVVLGYLVQHITSKP